MKYAAIVAVAIWLAVVVWIGVLVMHADPVARLVVPPPMAPDTTELQADTQRVREALANIEPLRQAQLVAPSAQPVLIATSAVGSDPALAAGAAVAASDAAGAEPAAVPPERKVSLIYHGPGFRRAVIDGVYVRPGSRLADGLRVVDIASDAVVLRDRQGHRRVIKVARDDMSVDTGKAKVTR